MLQGRAGPEAVDHFPGHYLHRADFVELHIHIVDKVFPDVSGVAVVFPGTQHTAQIVNAIAARPNQVIDGHLFQGMNGHHKTLFAGILLPPFLLALLDGSRNIGGIVVVPQQPAHTQNIVLAAEGKGSFGVSASRFDGRSP